MEKTSELVGYKKEQTEERFFNLCNDIAAARYVPDDREKIKELKAKFYKNFDDFQTEGYKPMGNITPENLEKFEEYRDREWTPETVEEILEYILSLQKNTEKKIT